MAVGIMGHVAAGGGESQDATMEYQSLIRASAVTVGSTGARIASGSRHLTLPTATNAANCTIPIAYVGSGHTTRAHLFSCYVGTNGTLTSEMGLLCKYANPTTERYVRIGTDNLIRLYDSAGNQYGHTSKHAVSTTGITHVAVCYDFLSPAGALEAGSGVAQRAYVTLWVDGNVQWDGLIAHASATMLSGASDLVWGEDLDAAVNRGVDVYLDDHSYRAKSASTGASASLPHVSTPGIVQVVGSASLPPTANATHTAWSSDYTSVDEYPADGAAWAGNLTNGAKETYTYSAANPTDSADTLLGVQLRAKARETSGAKSTYLALLRDASANEQTTAWVASGTSFVGQVIQLVRPTGGSFVYTDFDLTAGVSNLQFGMQGPPANAGSEVDALTGPEIVKYEALMSAGRMWQ